MVTDLTNSSPAQPLVFIPRQGKPQQLFVLLHGENADPGQLLPLADAIKSRFPQAVVFMPCVAHGEGVQHAALLAHLVEQVRHLQKHYQLSGQQTALAGFSDGASLALEASHARHDLAGRVLAFSGVYRELPQTAPPATLVHFFHGEDDTHVPVEQARLSIEHLADREGDATLDIAETLGHEMHPALIEQAMVRLTTCVPLRSWEEALASLSNPSQNTDRGVLAPIPPDRTVH